MTHADLLRRFQALKSSSSPSQSTVAPSSTTNPATHADDDDDEVEAYLAAFVQGNHSTLINLDPSQPATDAALAIAAVSGPDGRPASSQPTPTLPSEEQLEWETKALLQQLLALGVDLTDASRQTEQEEVDEEDADDQFNEEIIVHQAVDEAQLFPDKLPDQHQQQRQSSHDSLLPTSSIDPSLSLTSPSSARSPSDASLISQDHDVDPIHTRLASLISPPLTQPQLPTPILGSSLDPPTGTQAESTPSTSSIARLLALKPSSTLPITSNRLSNSSTDSAKQALTKMSMGNKQKKVFSVPGWEAERDQDVESWCCICSADATLLCGGCEDDLYCVSCFTQGHAEEGAEEMRRHRPRRFVFRGGFGKTASVRGGR